MGICKDYIAKGVDLILATEERPKLLKMLVKMDGFENETAASHNMVQPAVVVENSSGQIVYKWNWYDLEGTQKWEGKSNSPTVFLRPTTDSLYAALKDGTLTSSKYTTQIDTYPSEWPRPAFPYIGQLPALPSARARL